ncbi:MipA/OmpV family protein [Sphingomonas immobilis]|uniref:MipA/OmpV family protein n=1 Tax=Sphingomonas immobilis TaxID=3063997 RepID=A0ABT8ZVM5_9SPHN|nr:MipA/OmpV family protein [Sphingomonas sp. CA1-15]MDO7841628.1 MipA/OmpV family protein [Sphingomonas sp. CA1-15]
MNRSTNRRLLATFAAATTLAFAAPAFAQEGAAAAAPDATVGKVTGDSLTIGAAGVYIPDYEGSNDYRFAPAPIVLAKWHGFGLQILGNRASVDLIPDRGQWNFEAGPIGVINFNRSDPDAIKDIRVARLRERGNAFELGGYLGVSKTGVITSPYDTLSLSVSYRHDLTRAHDSGIWQPSISYVTPLSRKLAVGINAQAQHVERGYANAYFNIGPIQSAASGLPQYSTDGGWKSYTVAAFVTHSLTGDLLHGFKIVAGGGYTRLLGGFARSPIVTVAGTPNQWLGAVGVAYTF